MRIEQAEAILGKLKGQPVHEDYSRKHETYKPSGCMGNPGRLICTGEPWGDTGYITCNCPSWGTAVGRLIQSIVMPRGITFKRAVEALRVAETATS